MLVKGSAAYRHAGPVPEDAVVLNRHVLHGTRVDLLHALAEHGLATPTVVSNVLSDETERVLHGEAIDPTALEGNYGEDYNVLYAPPDGLAHAWPERAQALHARERHMLQRLIGGVVPLSAWYGHRTEVSDDGHLTHPITVFDSSDAPDNSVLGNLTYGHEDEAETAETETAPVASGSPLAVLVRPVVGELPLWPSLPYRAAWGEETQRALPKGREWARQRAVQAAVGTTAQEAVIDLGFDPRYRRPGDYVRFASATSP